jgi:hypothetical protein
VSVARRERRFGGHDLLRLASQRERNVTRVERHHFLADGRYSILWIEGLAHPVISRAAVVEK